jgi:RNA polymerase sigma-70 factor (ECF subfamily)
MGRGEQSDEQLLEAWTAGDQRAGAALVARHYEAIARFFAHRLGPDFEDLVQDTFMGFARGLPSFRRDCSVRIYLFKIARNKLLMAIRERMRDRERFDPSETTMADVDPSASAVLAAGDDEKLLVAALRSLPIDVQIVLELHYWEQLKIHEIAEILDLNVNNIKAKMMRGRKRLHEEMERLADSKDQLQTTLNRLSGWIVQLREEIGAEQAEV